MFKMKKKKQDKKFLEKHKIFSNFCNTNHNYMKNYFFCFLYSISKKIIYRSQIYSFEMNLIAQLIS